MIKPGFDTLTSASMIQFGETSFNMHQSGYFCRLPVSAPPFSGMHTPLFLELPSKAARPSSPISAKVSISLFKTDFCVGDIQPFQ